MPFESRPRRCYGTKDSDIPVMNTCTMPTKQSMVFPSLLTRPRTLSLTNVIPVSKPSKPRHMLVLILSRLPMTSKDKTRRSDFVGINGETSWILTTDHFTGIKHGDTRISKASPIHWLRHFLTTYRPLCQDKYVCMDQGDELYGNPDVQNLFECHDFAIHRTGAGASHQNGPVERSHRYVGDAV